MGAPEEASPDAIEFAERLLALLDEGRFTATYKFALLIALMDTCLEKVSPSGRAPDRLATIDLAHKVIELYWPHTAPFPSGDAPQVLRQNTQGQAEIVSRIRRFRERSLADPSAPLAEDMALVGTGRSVVEWLEEKLIVEGVDRVPREISLHTANSVGRDNMAGALESIARRTDLRRVGSRWIWRRGPGTR